MDMATAWWVDLERVQKNFLVIDQSEVEVLSVSTSTNLWLSHQSLSTFPPNLSGQLTPNFARAFWLPSERNYRSRFLIIPSHQFLKFSRISDFRKISTGTHSEVPPCNMGSQRYIFIQRITEALCSEIPKLEKFMKTFLSDYLGMTAKVATHFINPLKLSVQIAPNFAVALHILSRRKKQNNFLTMPSQVRMIFWMFLNLWTLGNFLDVPMRSCQLQQQIWLNFTATLWFDAWRTKPWLFYRRFTCSTEGPQVDQCLQFFGQSLRTNRMFDSVYSA